MLHAPAFSYWTLVVASSSQIPSQIGFDVWITRGQIFYMVTCVNRVDQAMCVGFAVDRIQNQTTKRFQNVCIAKMQMVYGFEISDGHSWSITSTSEIRNFFSLHTNRECKVGPRKADQERIYGVVSLSSGTWICTLASDRLVVREKKKNLEGVFHVYDLEANRWGVFGSTFWSRKGVTDFYKVTPSLSFVEEDEVKDTIPCYDLGVCYLTAVMKFIDSPSPLTFGGPLQNLKLEP
ncbi:hypothetical protein Bca4012_017632 [Brassica carinata]